MTSTLILLGVPDHHGHGGRSHFEIIVRPGPAPLKFRLAIEVWKGPDRDPFLGSLVFIRKDRDERFHNGWTYTLTDVEKGKP